MCQSCSAAILSIKDRIYIFRTLRCPLQILLSLEWPPCSAPVSFTALWWAHEQETVSLKLFTDNPFFFSHYSTSPYFKMRSQTSKKLSYIMPLVRRSFFGFLVSVKTFSTNSAIFFFFFLLSIMCGIDTSYWSVQKTSESREDLVPN